ncbi:hypothetical protein GCM10025869_04820 [Homoserinibacter gongjuensis]|uniref:Uncharacterized protein n=2 Tax=Homoserinibacter gongjuensis TaxID=1162968 RepID=A0ABQ6JNY0_9MICO|nr:hypothetical protein GCM10025869_04820 [Homoserinibacter gongjuensis]
MVTPSAAQPVVVQADPDLSVVLGAPTSTPAKALKPQLPEGDFAVEASRNVASPVGASARVDRPLDLASLDFDALPVVGRDEFSTSYQLDDGLKVAVISDAPANVRSGASGFRLTRSWNGKLAAGRRWIIRCRRSSRSVRVASWRR